MKEYLGEHASEKGHSDGVYRVGWDTSGGGGGEPLQSSRGGDASTHGPGQQSWRAVSGGERDFGDIGGAWGLCGWERKEMLPCFWLGHLGADD